MFLKSCFLHDVIVSHPYEPVLCKPVSCDYYIFRDSTFNLSKDDIYCCIISFLANKYSNEFLFSNFGLVIVPFYHDNSLNSFSYLSISNVSSDMIDFISNSFI